MHETDEQFLKRLKSTPATLDRMPSPADVERYREIEKQERVARIYRRIAK